MVPKRRDRAVRGALGRLAGEPPFLRVLPGFCGRTGGVGGGVARWDRSRPGRGRVGRETFGFDRHLNQLLYKCPEWLGVRDEIIVRDNGCDLGIEGLEIHKGIIIHHMNPLTIDDIINRNPDIFNPEYLISTVLDTHNGIHYGVKDLRSKIPEERRKNDTSPWLR